MYAPLSKHNKAMTKTFHHFIFHRDEALRLYHGPEDTEDGTVYNTL